MERCCSRRFTKKQGLGRDTLHLECRFDQEAFRVAVVTMQGQHFAYDAAARLALDMHDEIDSFGDFGFRVGESGLRMVAHHQIGESMQGLLCRIGMDGRKRSGMAGIEGIEQCARLNSAHFAEDDAIWPPAESRLEKVVESDVGLECIRLAFDGQDVRLLNLQFRSIFDDDEAFLFWNEIGQYPEQCGLSCAGSATDKQRLPVTDLFCQRVGEWPGQSAASNQIIDRVVAARELSNHERRSESDNRRNDGGQAAPIRELRVQYWIVFVEPFAELIGDDFEAGSEFARREGDRFFAANSAVAFVPP